MQKESLKRVNEQNNIEIDPLSSFLVEPPTIEPNINKKDINDKIHVQIASNYSNRVYKTYPFLKSYTLNIFKKAKQRLGKSIYVATALIFLLLGLFTRLWKISSGNFVLWDEAHFGKFGSHYLKRTFYFDVHPPLGKMLVAGAGWLAGYDGSFEFKSGEKYPESVNYIIMRSLLAIFGALLVPLSYLLGRELGLSREGSILAGILILFENGLITICRPILLDSMLIFFSTMTVYSYVRFRNCSKAAFSLRWWFNLILTGISIGLVSSVKWVGFFVTALIGFLTIEELFTILRWSNMRTSRTLYVSYTELCENYGQDKIIWIPNFFKYLKNFIGTRNARRCIFLLHFLARVLGLILVPILVYAISFWLHFKILNESGPGDANMSSLFQSRLQRSNLKRGPRTIYYGSQITIKSNSYGGGLLHSHVQTYPVGSKQQQVTTYHHRDTNNNWLVMYVPDNGQTSTEHDNKIENIPHQPVQDGSKIRLLHVATQRFLHSHSTFYAPQTSTEFEVTSYGGLSIPLDPNDIWTIEVISEIGNGKDKNMQSITDEKQTKFIHPLTTKFRLRHAKTGCYLRSRNIQLPDWGFKQGEVSCDPDWRISGGRSILWNIEEHVNEKLPNAVAEDYPSSFLADLRDHNVGMYITNNSLTPNAELEPSILTSKPWQWFLLFVGLRMSSFAEDAVRFYMLGNPFTWWSSSIAIVSLISLCAMHYLLGKRGINLLPAKKTEHQDIDDQGTASQNLGNLDQFYLRCKILLGGWAFNYMPFFLMGRVTYLHHYYPALVMANMCLSFLIDHLIQWYKYQKNGKKGSGLIGDSTKLFYVFYGLIAGIVFYLFRDTSYGMIGPTESYKHLAWLPTWNIVNKPDS